MKRLRGIGFFVVLFTLFYFIVHAFFSVPFDKFLLYFMAGALLMKLTED